MKISYNWLNEYFDGKLPAVEKAAEILTMNSLEVDSVEKLKSDYVLDVKVTPNMAHSCLCHRGIAGEFGALLNLKPKKYCREFVDFDTVDSVRNLVIKIENESDCRRYIGQLVEGVKIGPSPEWLKVKLENLGQRSINNLVDATNFVMLELGQPMHVFDADKLVGNIIEVKKAKAQDQITTLDGKQIILDESVLTISNNGKALAIAGIKGGVLAEIDSNTKNIVLESANFNPTLIRKTAQKIKIQTDASKRYENDLSPEVAGEAIDVLARLILEIASTKDTKFGEPVDVYPSPVSQYKLGVSVSEVEKLVGIKIAEEEITKIFARLNFIYTKVQDRFLVEIPSERLDLRIKEDLIEEILKVYGYGKLKDKTLSATAVKGQINKNFYYSNKIRQILCNLGFSEIYGYSFSKKGEIELANSVAPEKRYLRSNLSSSMGEYLDFNVQYSELVDMPQIKIFEISKVFNINDEHTNLVVGVKTPISNKGLKKDKDVLVEVVNKLAESFGQGMIKINKEENIVEFNLDSFIEKLPEPKSYDFELPQTSNDMRFKKISIYPFAVRDVAVFTPEGTQAEKVLSIIKNEAGSLLIKNRLFDVFTKKLPDGSAKTSYAYRLVLQSYERTLSEEEITAVMSRITSSLNSQSGWQVR